MKILASIFYLLVFAIPFGTRKLLHQFTQGFHEYETIFLYASDILLAVFLIVAAYVFVQESKKARKQESNATAFLKRQQLRTTMLAAFMLIAGISIFFATAKGLALYSFVRLLSATLFAVATAYVLRQRIVSVNRVFGALAASAVVQSLIAFAQFAKQGSVGLWFLGEPALSGNAAGIAKFAVGGGRLLRAYGTFPHPNVLGAFLVLGLLASCFLWLRYGNNNVIASPANNSLKIEGGAWQSHHNVRLLLRLLADRNDGIYVVNTFLILLGILLTFSRSAWFVAVIASVALLLYCFMQRELRRRALFLFFTLVASGYTLVAILSPFIFARATISAGEPSVTERVEYGALGVELIKAHPFGVGIGSQVLYAVENGLYQQRGMTRAWEWEPIHNIYLLIASEVGVIGLFLFMFFIAAILISNYQFLISNFGIAYFIRNWKLGIRNSHDVVLSLNIAISRLMLLSLLVFGIADHFLWTLQPGRLMLWLVIGLML